MERPVPCGTGRIVFVSPSRVPRFGLGVRGLSAPSACGLTPEDIFANVKGLRFGAQEMD